MKTLLLSSIIILSPLAQAHGDRDWREDYLAYLSVDYGQPLSKPKSQKTLVKRIDMKFFEMKLKILTGVSSYGASTIKERRTQKSLNIARAFLKEEYKKIGFETSSQPFGSGTNCIAEKKGTVSPNKVLILSSHIDSVRNRGANDNGTGTIGLLAVAQELAKHNYAYTIRVLSFDKEEVGLAGSDAYVATLKKQENIIGNINFEMMGYNSRKDGAFHVIDCKKGDSPLLTQAMQTSISKLGLELTIVKACTDRSDHASFWRKNIPAVVISENFFGGDSDPCYHAKCDVMDERLDYKYMGMILEATLDATEGLIQVQ